MAAETDYTPADAVIGPSAMILRIGSIANNILRNIITFSNVITINSLNMLSSVTTWQVLMAWRLIL
jgi:hypothetical protein